MNNPSLGKTQTLHLKLQEDKKNLAYPNHEPNNKTCGHWKAEVDFLICTGTTAQTKANNDSKNRFYINGINLYQPKD